MRRRKAALSGYLGMWVFALFDLPVKKREHKKNYVTFRKLLLSQGFSMLQYSVYARYCGSEEIGDRQLETIRRGLPKEGHVRLLMVTDRQFGKMRVFLGKKETECDNAPRQLLLF